MLADCLWIVCGLFVDCLWIVCVVDCLRIVCVVDCLWIVCGLLWGGMTYRSQCLGPRTPVPSLPRWRCMCLAHTQPKTRPTQLAWQCVRKRQWLPVLGHVCITEGFTSWQAGDTLDKVAKTWSVVTVVSNLFLSRMEAAAWRSVFSLGMRCTTAMLLLASHLELG
jgi:hypothetical protein